VRFGEDAFWVDSAIDLCKRAVSIDPTQARAYVVLARAYRCKNLFDQAAETITKALRLAPNDAEVNFRAGSQRLGSSADSEAYSMLRKAYSLDPNDPRKSYLLGLICAVIGEDELREKCMQRTIQLESDADRKKMLECELLTQRLSICVSHVRNVRVIGRSQFERQRPRLPLKRKFWAPGASGKLSSAVPGLSYRRQHQGARHRRTTSKRHRQASIIASRSIPLQLSCFTNHRLGPSSRML
jgi:tetratricopeptide (TPR) repeat protein